ncbi:MAG: CARDB domain-containing protein [Acidobacteriota bacterium]
MKRVLCCLAFAIAFTSHLAEAAYIDITILKYEATPERKLTDDFGDLSTFFEFTAELKGFSFNVSTDWREGTRPNTLINLDLESYQTVTWGTPERRSPFSQHPGLVHNDLVYAGVNPEPRFIGYYGARSVWSPFTFPDRTYEAKAEPRYRAYWLVAGSISFDIGDNLTVSIDSNSTLPGSQDAPGVSPIEGSSRPWSPICKDSLRIFDLQDGKCVCKSGNPADRPDCRPGAGCIQPERMTKIDGNCACLPDFPVPILLGNQLVGCMTNGEASDAAQGGPNFRDRALQATARHWLNPGWIVFYDCDEANAHTSGSVPNSQGSGKPKFICQMVVIPLFLNGGSATGSSLPPERWACFDADNLDGWVRCENDSHPGLPLDLSYANFRAQLPECNTSNAPEWCRRINPGRRPVWDEDPTRPADLRVPVAAYLPSAPVASDQLELQVTLHNEGSTVAPSHHYRVTLRKPDGSTESRDRYAGTLGPGRSRFLTIRGEELGYPELEDGLHRVTFEIDSQNEVAEGDESNNLMTLSFEVGEGQATSEADLRITRLRSSDANPASGHPLEVEMTITNVGGTTASPSRATVAVLTPTDSAHAETFDLPALPPMASESLRFVTGEVVDGGEHDILAIADSDNDVAESDEGNNLAERTVIVHDSQLDCLPCTSGAIHEVGTEQCQPSSNGAPSPGLHHVCRGVRSDGTTCANDPNNPNGWEFIGPQCPPEEDLPDGWHPNACGEPDVCRGTATD